MEEKESWMAPVTLREVKDCKGGSTTRSTGRSLGQPSPDSDKLPPEVAVMHSFYSSSIFFKP